jgi:hypothetical protein
MAMKVPRVNPPSDQALVDRDRRSGLRPTTTTALLMGDPVAVRPISAR